VWTALTLGDWSKIYNTGWGGAQKFGVLFFSCFMFVFAEGEGTVRLYDLEPSRACESWVDGLMDLMDLMGFQEGSL